MLLRDAVTEFRITAYCENPACPDRHSADLDLEALMAKLGPDHGALAADLRPHLKCSSCGSKHLSLIYAPRGNARFTGRSG